MTLTYDVERVKEATQFLVDDSYYKHRIIKLRNTLARPRALPYKDEEEVLNELLVLGRQDTQALENLLELVEWKRTAKPKTMTSYMATLRRRERKIAELEERLTGRKLNKDERSQAVHRQFDLWRAELGKILPRPDARDKESNEVRERFYTIKEDELDDLLKEARAMDKTVVRKREVVIERQPKTVLGAKLKAALTKPGTLKTKK